MEDSEQKIKDRFNSKEIKSELISLRSKIEQDHISNEETVTLFKNICINISDKSFKKIRFVGQGKIISKEIFRNGLMMIAKKQKKKEIRK